MKVCVLFALLLVLYPIYVRSYCTVLFLIWPSVPEIKNKFKKKLKAQSKRHRVNIMIMKRASDIYYGL